MICGFGWPLDERRLVTSALSPASSVTFGGVKVGGTSSKFGSPTVIGMVSVAWFPFVSAAEVPSVTTNVTDAGPRKSVAATKLSVAWPCITAEPSLFVAVALRMIAGRPDGTSTMSARFQVFEPFMRTSCSGSGLRNGGGKACSSSAFASGFAGTMMNAVPLSWSISLVRR